MFKNICIHVSAILICSTTIQPAMANFQGTWLGDGVAKTPKTDFSCDFIGLDLDQSSHELILRQGQYQCAEVTGEYPRSLFKITDGGCLFYEGECVGKISDRQITLERAEEGFKLTLTLAEDHSSLSYLEEWQMDKDFFIVQGTLYYRSAISNEHQILKPASESP